MRMRPSSNLISDNESRHVEFYSGEILNALWGKGLVVRQKLLIERIGAVSGYNSHKEIDFGAKLALPALLADFRLNNYFANHCLFRRAIHRHETFKNPQLKRRLRFFH